MEDQCNDVLVKQNVSLFNQNEHTRFLFSKIVSKETYEKASHDSGVLIASYEDWKEEASKDFDKTDFDYSRDNIISAITIYSPEFAIDAWRDCMSSGKSRFACSVFGDPKGLIFRLVFDWHPSEEIGGYNLEIDDFDVRSEPSSDRTIKIKKIWEFRPGKTTILLSRETLNDTITGSVTGNVVSSNFTTSFVIPAYKEPKKRERKVMYKFIISHADNSVVIKDNNTGIDLLNTGIIDQDPPLNIEFYPVLKPYPFINNLQVYGYNAPSDKGNNPYHFIIDVFRVEKVFGGKIQYTLVKNYNRYGIGGSGFWLNDNLLIQAPDGAILVNNESEL